MQFGCLIVILIATNGVGGIEKTCPIYETPRPVTLRGHVDYYRQNLSDYPLSLDVGQLLQDALNNFFGRDRKPDTLKFTATLAEPFMFAENDELGFTAWGPMYSLVKETAVYLNCR